MFNLQEEIICDYPVTVKTKKIWSKQLGILAELDRVCTKYNITYFAVCGTLLGAVRHKGFIPWDDDMDVGLLRDDYEKLMLHADEFKKPYFLQNVYTDNECYTHTSRLRDSSTTAIVLSDKACKCNHGIYIDIFPFDHLADNKIQRFFQFAGLTVYSRLLQYSKMYYLNKQTGPKYRICNAITECLGYQKLFTKYQKLCAKYNHKKTKCLGIISGNKMSKEFRYPLEACETIIQLPFEDRFINVPKGYDACLTVDYGNYMEFPPVEKRGAWHEGVLYIDPDIDYITVQRKNGWIR